MKIFEKKKFHPITAYSEYTIIGGKLSEFLAFFSQNAKKWIFPPITVYKGN